MIQCVICVPLRIPVNPRMTGSILVHLETASRNSRRWVKLQTGIEQAILPQLFQCNIKPIMDNLSYCIENNRIFYARPSLCSLQIYCKERIQNRSVQHMIKQGICPLGCRIFRSSVFIPPVNQTLFKGHEG